jgi:CRISPR-associated protein Cas1
MARRVTSIATPVAHLVGPGKIKVVNGRLAYSTGQGQPLRLDPSSLRTVFCYGPVGVSDEAVRVLFRHRVEVAFMTLAGNRCHGRMVRADGSSTLLRLQQYHVFLDESRKCEFARHFVAKKIQSQLAAARHYQRQGHSAAGRSIKKFQKFHGQSIRADNLAELRGIEGACTAAWFRFFAELVRPPWSFPQRSRRPPTDPVNALLSLGYTFLLNRAVARLEAAGLEVALGTLHEYRAGRPSLACDLIEPQRVPAVDRWVIGLCNEKRLAPTDFVSRNGGVYLEESVFSSVLADWETRWYKMDHEHVLEGAVTALVAQIRHCAGLSPILQKEGEKR